MTLRDSARLLPILLLALFLSGPVAAAPAPPPDKRPAKPQNQRPANKQREERRQLARLTVQAIELLEQKKYPEAEKALEAALKIDPKESTNLYNMACLKALTGNKDTAVDYLVKSTEQGFVDFALISRDPDLASLREMPRYKSLLGRKEEIQQRFAKEVVDSLEKQFGKGYLYEIDNANKLIFATNTDRPTLEALKQNLTRQARGLREFIFTQHADQYINVVLPSLKDYAKLVPSPAIAGFYNHESRTLISRQLGRVITHEFTHALHYADFSPLGQDHPIWLLEGFATLFETITWEDGKFTPHDSEHLFALHHMAKRNKLVPLDKLMKMNQSQLMRNPTAGYGQSGSVLLYLYELGILREYYEAVKAGFDEKAPDRGTIAALEKVAGKMVSEFESDWRKWMEGRTPPPQSTGPDGPFIGVKFGQGNDGLKVEEVVADGPAAKAGIKAGDLIVGINDEEVRDHQTLVPLLSEHQVGERVALKVRRGKEYRDVPVVLAKRPEEAEGADPFGDIQVSRAKGGMRVEGVGENSSAAKAGLREGDLMIGIGGLPVRDERTLMTALEKQRDRKAISIKIRRDGKEQTLEVKLEDPPAAEAPAPDNKGDSPAPAKP